MLRGLNSKGALKRHLSLFFILGIILSIGIIAYSLALPNNQYTINGNSVEWENDYGKIIVTPHTLTNPNDCFEVEATSYLPTQNIDCAVAGNSGKLRGRSAWFWANISHLVKKINVTTISSSYSCNNNLSTCYENIPYTQYITENVYYSDWNNINNQFSKQPIGNRDYYVISGINWQKDTTKKVKLCFDAKMQKLPDGTWGINEKVDIFCKRSSDTIQEALNNGNMFIVDPWQNTSCNNRVSTLVTPSQTDANQMLIINLTKYINFNYAYVYENISNGILPFFNITSNTFYTNLSVTANTKVGIDIYYNCLTLSPRYNISHVALEGWDFESQAEVTAFGSKAAAGTWATNTANKFIGSSSAQQTALVADRYIRGYAKVNETNLTLVYYFYDPVHATSKVQVEFFGELGGGDGYRFGSRPSVDATYYSFQNGSTGTGPSSNIPRSVGWHRVEGHLNVSGSTMLLDGKFGFQAVETKTYPMLGLSTDNDVGQFDLVFVYRDYGENNPTVNVGIEEGQTNLTEESARTAIQTGIVNKLPTAIIYTDQQIYARYLNGTQILGTFDKVAVYGNQRWAFNYVGTDQSYTFMTNLAPSLYVWENSSITTSDIQSQVEALINSTLSS